MVDLELIKKRALEIYSSHLSQKKNIRDLVMGYTMHRLIGRHLYQLSDPDFIDFVERHIDYREDGQCRIHLPNAAAIYFEIAPDKESLYRIEKLNERGGMFCVGQKDRNLGWVFPGWNSNRCFRELDVAIGMAYQTADDPYWEDAVTGTGSENNS